MKVLSTDKASIEDALTRPMTPADMATAGKQLKAMGDELDTLENRWLELNELIEQAEAEHAVQA